MFGRVEVNPYTYFGINRSFSVVNKELFLGNWKVELKIVTDNPFVREVWVSVNVGKELWEVENWDEIYNKLYSTGIRRVREFYERITSKAYDVLRRLENIENVNVSVRRFIQTVAGELGVKTFFRNTNDGEYISYSVEVKDKVDGFKNPVTTLILADFPSFVGCNRYYVTIKG